MSDYGSGQSYGQGAYGGATPGYEQQQPQQYGGQQPGAGPYGTGQQPQQQYGGYGQQQPPGQSFPSPSAPRSQQDKLALIATIVTYVGYVCAGAGVLGFIMWLAADGDGVARFATALEALVAGLGLGGLNVALGSYLSSKR